MQSREHDGFSCIFRYFYVFACIPHIPFTFPCFSIYIIYILLLFVWICLRIFRNFSCLWNGRNPFRQACSRKKGLWQLEVQGFHQARYWPGTDQALINLGISENSGESWNIFKQHRNVYIYIYIYGLPALHDEALQARQE